MFSVDNLVFNKELDINPYLEKSYITNTNYKDINIIKNLNNIDIDYSNIINKDFTYTTKYWYENKNICKINKNQYAYIANDKEFINWGYRKCLCSINWKYQKNNNDGMRVVVMCGNTTDNNNYLCKKCLKKNKSIENIILLDNNLKYYYTDEKYKSSNDNKLCILPEEIELHLSNGMDISETDAKMYIKKYYKENWNSFEALFD